jgi:hypothetical protein
MEMIRNKRATYLKEGILLFLLQFIGTEELKTTFSLLWTETVIVTLEEFEDIVNDNGF